MLDKDLVIISELNNPANSFTFYADFQDLSYDISIIHTNIDTVKANEVYTHIRNRNTKLEATVIFIETPNSDINDCVAFFENMTTVSDQPYKAVNMYYDGRQVINKNYLITSVGFKFMDYIFYDNDTSAKPRRAEITLTLQVYQTHYEEEEIEPTAAKKLLFF